MDYQDPHLEEPGPAALGYPTKTLHGRQKRFFTERVACRPLQRERLCRCVTRPTVCLERLSTNATGQVSYELKHPLRDGTTHILFTPDDFLARLAALVPRPWSNLIRYFYRIGGGFAPNSPFRRTVVPGSAKPARNKSKKPTIQTATEPSVNQAQPCSPLSWAERLTTVVTMMIIIIAIASKIRWFRRTHLRRGCRCVPQYPEWAYWLAETYQLAGQK